MILLKKSGWKVGLNDIEERKRRRGDEKDLKLGFEWLDVWLGGRDFGRFR